MLKYPKPRIVVSRCLGFANCRFNGQVINDNFIESLQKFCEIITPCPEMDIGLGAPRFPVRLVKKNNNIIIMQHETLKDCREDFINFCEKFISEYHDIHGAILKYGSPSCGSSNVNIYKSLDKGPAVDKGTGLFAEFLKKEIQFLAIENEGRIKNYKIRFDFYSLIFTLARFSEIKKTFKILDLVKFHSQHKFLLMNFSETGMRKLGKITSNSEKISVQQLFDDYENILKETLSKTPKKSSSINVLMHMLGFFSKKLNKDEKKFYHYNLELYKESRIPYSSVTSLIHSLALRFNETYLLDQYILQPFPSELMELKNSGQDLPL